MFKLLSKQEIDRAKAKDREREIAEGLKLSRKVDSLRELRAEEEVKLENWRRETLAGIQAKIDEKTKELDTIEEKIKQENEKWRKLQKTETESVPS